MTKKLDTDNKPEEICSVSAMARKLKLSHTWFYQLVQKEAFPPPAYCIRTRRPLYPRDLQEQCLKIRRSGISSSGQPVFFYRPRTKRPVVSRTRSNGTRRELAHILGKMGVKVTQKQLNGTVDALYPEGLPEQREMGPVIRELFQYLRKEL